MRYVQHSGRKSVETRVLTGPNGRHLQKDLFYSVLLADGLTARCCGAKRGPSDLFKGTNMKQIRGVQLILISPTCLSGDGQQFSPTSSMASGLHADARRRISCPQSPSILYRSPYNSRTLPVSLLARVALPSLPLGSQSSAGVGALLVGNDWGSRVRRRSTYSCKEAY